MARSGTPVSIITRLDATGFAQIRVLDKFADAGTNALPSWRARVTLDSGTETPISRLLVATKAKDVASGVSSLRSRLVSGAAVVLLGNGLLGARDQLWARAADEGWEEFNLFLGGSTHGSYLRASDDPADFRSVVHAGLGSAWLGPDTRGPATSVDAKRIAEELEAGELGIKNVRSVPCCTIAICASKLNLVLHYHAGPFK
jgi:ketopantoate reductase